VECLKFNPELRYTQSELEALLPEVPDEPMVKAPAP
jgi:putative DNA primase/helicase